MYRWEFNDPLVRAVFDALPRAAQRGLVELMDAMVLVDPMEYRRAADERPGNLRTLHFDPGGAGLVAVLILERDDLVVVEQIGWTG